MNIHLTDEATETIMKRGELQDEAWLLLKLINAEWESDPMAVQCFDLRIVERVKKAVRQHEDIEARRLTF